jgi:aminopeptidase-like protein
VNTAPLARTAGLVVEPIDDGVVVYDEETGRAHALNAGAAAVWSAADGTRDIAAIAQRAGMDPAAAVAALDQLHANGLLDELIPGPITVA